MAEINVLAQTIRDVKDDKVFTARFIGPSTLNNTRITVNSALTRFNDKIDTYRFRNTRDTDVLSFTYKSTADVKFQLLDRTGKVIADNTATEGLLKENYDALALGRFEAKAGDYFIRVTRGQGVPKAEPVEFFFQITNGGFNTDYDTQETPPPRDAASVNVKVQGTTNTLNNISQLQQSLLGSDNFFTKLRSVYGSIISTSA